jgi:oxygen-independent coproporphyrinogen-3 oxidase
MAVYSLYLHIPFCRQRCSYCDFNTYTTIGELKGAYVRALIEETQQVGRQAAASGEAIHIQTIFFGGGTPSLLTPQAINDILCAARQAFTFLPDVEITLEANPGTVNTSYLAALRAAGVNRLSYGVQSALPGELALLGREHDFATAVEAVEQARSAGFDNLNLDFIYGLPGQSVGDWERTLSAGLALQPEHLSLYCLTIEPGTPMQQWLSSGRIQPPDPDLAAEQYELAGKLLAEQGYIQYEISNWAKPGRECRHNLTYWRNQSYLGLGAGAHGFAAGYRYQVVRQPRAYIRRMIAEPSPGGQLNRFPLSAAVAAFHRLARDEAMTDTVITQLRLLNEGLDLVAFAHTFGQSLDEVYNGTVGQLEGWGLLQRQNGRLLLTEKGRFLSNQVFYRFM